MPEEPTTPDLVELTRQAINALNHRDFDAAMSYHAPDAVWDTSNTGVGISLAPVTAASVEPIRFNEAGAVGSHVVARSRVVERDGIPDHRGIAVAPSVSGV